MKYTLFLYSNENNWSNLSDVQRGEAVAAYQGYIKSLNEAGVFVSTDRLAPTSSSTTISLMDGKTQIQDGPYAVTKEQIGGLFVINVNDMDEAIEWAKKCPASRYGYIEIRPSILG